MKNGLYLTQCWLCHFNDRYNAKDAHLCTIQIICEQKESLISGSCKKALKLSEFNESGIYGIDYSLAKHCSYMALLNA